MDEEESINQPVSSPSSIHPHQLQYHNKPSLSTIVLQTNGRFLQNNHITTLHHLTQNVLHHLLNCHRGHLRPRRTRRWRLGQRLGFLFRLLLNCLLHIQQRLLETHHHHRKQDCLRSIHHLLREPIPRNKDIHQDRNILYHYFNSIRHYHLEARHHFHRRRSAIPIYLHRGNQGSRHHFFSLGLSVH